MTLLISSIAAVISAYVWYTHLPNDTFDVKFLVYLFTGASLMWFVDAVFEFAELQSAYFTPSLEDMLNDTYLGLSVVTLALVVWTIKLILKDPKGVIKNSLH